MVIYNVVFFSTISVVIALRFDVGGEQHCFEGLIRRINAPVFLSCAVGSKSYRFRL